MTNMESLANIAAVERDTGLGKDTLRVWERRYGFPQPLRGPNGDRFYPPEQVARLRLIRRLIDLGHRPGKLVAASDDELRALAGPAPETAGADSALPDPVLLLRGGHREGLRQHLQQHLMRDGLQRFVLDTLPRLNRAVGEAWGRGDLQVFEEHLYTEQVQALLRQAIAALPPGRERPRLLLTTVPDEQHVLGILMLEALFVLDGAHCVSLGTQTPLADIAAAAIAHRVDAVALSFSAAFPARQVTALVRRLRTLLPAAIALWIGGGGAGRLAPEDGVALAASLPAGLELLAALRAGSTH